MKNCLHCGFEIEEDDNFCPKCGHWTIKGYTFFSDEKNREIINGAMVKQKVRVANLFSLLFIFFVVSIGICLYRGKDILQPFVYIKRQIMNYNYGYNTTILKTDNQYFNVGVNDKASAKEVIINDFNEQKWQCTNRYEMGKIEEELQKLYDIPVVSFCEMSLKEGKSISDVIKKMYSLFPEIKGYLTNISVTNAEEKNAYVALFQPVYQFVNSTNSLGSYKRVNKTQILLNSYYFLNDDILSRGVKDNWYIDGASWESLIAHEFGHYITFVTLLKSKRINSVLLVDNGNDNFIDELVDLINNQSYSKDLVDKAIQNYNGVYEVNLGIEDFAGLISNYASNKDVRGNFIYDEIIAEAVHDYYVNGDNASKASLEIVSILKSRLC